MDCQFLIFSLFLVPNYFQNEEVLKKTVESWKEKAKTQEDNMGKLKKQAEEKLAQ